MSAQWNEVHTEIQTEGTVEFPEGETINDTLYETGLLFVLSFVGLITALYTLMN